MKAIGPRVLIKRTETRIKGIIMEDQKSGYKFNTITEIVQIGEGVPGDPGFKEGDEVVIDKHALPQGLRLISDVSKKDIKVLIGLLHWEEILGVEDPEFEVGLSEKALAYVAEAEEAVRAKIIAAKN